MESSRFLQHGHKKEDVDVVICWKDDVTDSKERQKLPKIFSLHDLVAKLVDAGEIEL